MIPITIYIRGMMNIATINFVHRLGEAIHSFIEPATIEATSLPAKDNEFISIAIETSSGLKTTVYTQISTMNYFEANPLSERETAAIKIIMRGLFDPNSDCCNEGFKSYIEKVRNQE